MCGKDELMHDEREREREAAAPAEVVATCPKCGKEDCNDIFHPPADPSRGARLTALRDVERERERQIEMWGRQVHEPTVWLAILGEEFGEVAKEVLELRVARRTSNAAASLHRDQLRNELVQVAAVAVAMIEHIDAEAKGGQREA